ncbi:MAG: hypothetical protein HYU66_17655 [Armatimonadetes bacterium]|nr:hypothetical protein [Armatimonadota bacterium]
MRPTGNTVVALSSRENEDVAQSFEVPIGLPGLTALGGTLGPHAFVVGQRDRGRLWLQVNGGAERAAELAIGEDAGAKR